MHRARLFESNRQGVPGWGADQTAPRPTPLTLVSGVVAGDDLQSVTATVSEALGCPVAIAIPALGEPVIHPPGALAADQGQAILAHATATIDGTDRPAPPVIAEAVAIQIGEQVVGIVAAAQGDAEAITAGERRAWLEAAAAASSVAALIRDVHEGAPDDSPSALLLGLSARTPDDVSAFLARARRLGCDLGGGGSAICARGDQAADQLRAAALTCTPDVLLAETGRGQILGLAPHGTETAATELAGVLREGGFTVAVSAPRRDPSALHEALREAELLVELALTPGVQPGQDDTYRLLIGVLLRDRDELVQLRARTISPLADYDARHDTDLLATLQAFLAHDGSTTETAEAMALHRHTVGYRLTRVHEVSGLSPYETDGRERLSLGLKAHEILGAAQRRDDAIRGSAPLLSAESPGRHRSAAS